ncbi:hypothetical protein C2G38_2190405 [Gigaspora rosea]|uniref:SWIM-type domain-containing protein n=1 Tax=Gigaspora rosea TaxID=44941 RepID=A0A397V4J5_9GLOM|nr:hypothetical protein C2G38_2190405 [Gigaspora rosea]
MLSSELQKAENRDYLKNLPFTIGSSSAVHVFPDIVDLLKSEIKYMAANTTSLNYVALLQDNLHVCTCLLLISKGLVCRHFFQIILQTKTAKFSMVLIKSRWYKKDLEMHDFNTTYDSSGLSANTINTRTESLALTSICDTWNSEQDTFIQDIEIEESITSRQIYGECAALGRKLASLVAEFRLMHVVATLQGLIQQVEQANSNSTSSQCQYIIDNPLQTKPRGRPANRLKAAIEEGAPKNSKDKSTSANVRSRDAYTCRNCFQGGHNARSCSAPCNVCKATDHTYLHCQNA